MNSFIFGNMFSAAAAVFLLISVFKHEKTHVALFQIFECCLLAVAYFLLGGITGMITISMSIVRNTLVYLKKMTTPIMWTIMTIAVTCGIIFNRQGIFGYFPIVSSCLYTYVLCQPHFSVRTLKIFILLSQSMWGIYNLYSGAIPSFYANVCITAATVYTLWRHKRYPHITPEHIPE